MIISISCGLKRQTAPHVHNVGFTPDRRFLYAVDLGADKIVMYNYKDGVLKENTDYTVNVVPGSGPRHLIFSQDGRYGYLINEIANKIMVFKYNEGRMSLVQAIHCVPRHFKGFNAAAAIHLTKSSFSFRLKKCEIKTTNGICIRFENTT